MVQHLKKQDLTNIGNANLITLDTEEEKGRGGSDLREWRRGRT
jgi:hypothetical protein